jgi:cob(I)alamin adenosyltransferase
MGNDMQGYIHIYTGDGKGKTTAALGLAIRAVGAGKRVCLIQFLKTGNYSEIKALRQLKPQIHIEQFGTGRFVRGRPTAEDQAMADKGLDAARAALANGENDVVILDEINVAGALGLVEAQAVLKGLQQRAPHVEVILTGRRAPSTWCEAADLVTEMQARRHYFERGVTARIGIEK